MRSPRRSLLLALALSLAAPAASSLLAQGAQYGPFDMKSGRYGSAIPSELPRQPDTLATTGALAWGALAEVFARLGIPLSVVDTGAHVVGALRVTHRRPIGGERLSRLLECGNGPYGPNAERYTVQITVLSNVVELPDGRTLLDTRVGGVASPNGLNSSVRCASTGALEERITAELRKLTKG